MFIKKKENFICENCDAEVVGDGFTNHCPDCLWSKHVDNDPGDRKSGCGGLMEPTRAFLDHGENVIVHRCQKCKIEKNIKVAKSDDQERIVELSAT